MTYDLLFERRGDAKVVVNEVRSFSKPQGAIGYEASGEEVLC